MCVRHMLCTLSSNADRSTRFTLTTVFGTTTSKAFSFVSRMGRCKHQTRELGGVFASCNFQVICSRSLSRPVTSKFCFAVTCPKVAKKRLVRRLVCCNMDTVSLDAANDGRRNLHTYASFVGPRRCTLLRRHLGLFGRGRATWLARTKLLFVARWRRDSTFRLFIWAGDCVLSLFCWPTDVFYRNGMWRRVRSGSW